MRFKGGRVPLQVPGGGNDQRREYRDWHGRWPRKEGQIAKYEGPRKSVVEALAHKAVETQNPVPTVQMVDTEI